MRLRLHQALALLVVALMAGCVDENPKPSPAAAPEPTVLPTTEPVVAYTANGTDMGAHTHDEWGSETELTLLQGSASTDTCSDNPFMPLFRLVAGVIMEQEANYGCATFTLPEGVIVPEGTARLRVTIDATQALVAGGMQLSYRNEQIRFASLEETNEAQHEWIIETTPVEWDLPHNIETTWAWTVSPSGSPAILNGEIDVLVVAERLPDWEPILASAHIDHWSLDTHHFVTPGVLRALDTNVTIEYPSFADRITGNDGSEPVPLADIIPPGTGYVTLAVQWGSIGGCPPGHGCWVVPFLTASTGSRARWGTEAERTDTYSIHVFQVPDDLSTDSPYAEASIYAVAAFIRECPNGEMQQTPIPFFNGCMGEAVASASAETRIEVEAWQAPPDLPALKARLGLA